jgi:hypothetical protein
MSISMRRFDKRDLPFVTESQWALAVQGPVAHRSLCLMCSTIADDTMYFLSLLSMTRDSRIALFKNASTFQQAFDWASFVEQVHFISALSPAFHSLLMANGR